MLYEYDINIYVNVDKEEEFLTYFHYLKNILCVYEKYMLPYFILQKKSTPQFFILLSTHNPFLQNNNNNHNIFEQFFITHDLSYVIKNNVYVLKLNILSYKIYIDENDILITWLLYISQKFHNLHIEVYQSTFDHHFDYIENILYIHFHNNDFIDIYDINVDTYYLKKYGNEILNNGFHILYTMYKELSTKNNSYEIYNLHKLLYNMRSSEIDLLNYIHLFDKKYINTLCKLNDLCKVHKYIKHLIIDETIKMLNTFNEIYLIKFQYIVKHKLKLKKIHHELDEYNYLPPFSEEEFHNLFENKYFKIYSLGGPLFREKKYLFYTSL